MDDLLKMRQLGRRLGQTEVREPGLPFASSHPSGVAAGYAQFRTDLGLIEYYDGTRWISLPCTPVAIVPNRTTVAVNTTWSTRVRTDYPLYVEAYAISTNVVAPNSGANFWTITCQGVNLSLTAGTNVFVPTTAADTAGVETDHSGNVLAANVAPANNAYLHVSVVKTGAPGNLGVAVTAYTRMIIP